jgi:hypothetical protein
MITVIKVIWNLWLLFTIWVLLTNANRLRKRVDSLETKVDPSKRFEKYINGKWREYND